MINEYLNFILLAFVQGIAEFLPISSSGHLVVLERFIDLGLNASELFFFNLLVHVATLFATLVFYRNDIFTLIVSTIREFVLLSQSKKSLRDLLFEKSDVMKTESDAGNHTSALDIGVSNNLSSTVQKYTSTTLMLMLLVTTMITGTIGILLKPLVSDIHNFGIIGILFMINGGILLSGKLRPPTQYTLTEKKTFYSALRFVVILGVVQGLAVFPGISRSGSTITAAILLGLTDRDAMKYSILCSIPVIIGAFLLELLDFISSQTIDAININLLQYLVATITSFVIGYCALHILYRLVKKQRIYLFAYYVFVVGVTVFSFNLFFNNNL